MSHPFCSCLSTFLTSPGKLEDESLGHLFGQLRYCLNKRNVRNQRKTICKEFTLTRMTFASRWHLRSWSLHQTHNLVASGYLSQYIQEQSQFSRNFHGACLHMRRFHPPIMTPADNGGFMETTETTFFVAYFTRRRLSSTGWKTIHIKQVGRHYSVACGFSKGFGPPFFLPLNDYQKMVTDLWLEKSYLGCVYSPSAFLKCPLIVYIILIVSTVNWRCSLCLWFVMWVVQVSVLFFWAIKKHCHHKWGEKTLWANWRMDICGTGVVDNVHLASRPSKWKILRYFFVRVKPAIAVVSRGACPRLSRVMRAVILWLLWTG